MSVGLMGKCGLMVQNVSSTPPAAETGLQRLCLPTDSFFGLHSVGQESELAGNTSTLGEVMVPSQKIWQRRA